MSGYSEFKKDVSDYAPIVFYSFCLYLIFLTYPSVMVSISIIDIFTDDPGGCHVPLLITWFILALIQWAMVKNIKHCWGIVVFWYLISTYPFIKFLGWMGSTDDIPFPGIDWMPW